jgi:hypothetical protein
MRRQDRTLLSQLSTPDLEERLLENNFIICFRYGKCNKEGKMIHTQNLNLIKEFFACVN